MTTEQTILVIGIDIGKNSFHIVGLDEAAAEVVAWPSVVIRRFIRLGPDLEFSRNPHWMDTPRERLIVSLDLADSNDELQN